LDEQIADQGAITYRGVVETSRKPVFVHLIPQDMTTEEKRSILSRLQRRMSLASGRNGLLDIRREGEQLYAITEIIAEFTGFSDWLNQESPERPPSTNTVDREIAQFDSGKPSSDPKPAFPRMSEGDHVAKIFAKPVLATDIRGQKAESLEEQYHQQQAQKPGYSPAVAAGPSPYTMVVEPGRRAEATAAHTIPSGDGPPVSGLEASNMKVRIAVLESQVGMWKMAAIAAAVVAGFCLIFVLVLLMQSK
jgi:hypothetical protein